MRSIEIRVRTRRGAVGLATVAALLVPALLPSSATAASKTHTYKPPFHKGAQGGDQFNYVYSDPSSGQVAVFRGYPEFNPFTCGGSRGGWVTLGVPVKTTDKIASVEIDYSNAVVDTYSFLTATVKRGGVYVGSKDVRGPVLGSGKVNVPIDLGTVPAGSNITIDFGVLVSSSCPNFDEAMAQFTKVVVHDA
jgi:hypothetical protein